ncbi:MAG: formate dehydrogenase accessory sulfurtransferase FdhD [Planctomycetota bacterium]|jgi:FdhD protein
MDPIETYTLRVLRFRDGKWSREDRGFPLEVPVAFYTNASLLVTLSATPSQLEALAVGFLFTERFIAGREDVLDVSAQADRRRGQVWVELKNPPEPAGEGIFTSGCGRGLTFLCVSDYERFTPIESSAAFSVDALRRSIRDMKDEAVVYRETGGLHAAACLCEDGTMTVAEDVGRHNAVDKVVGKRLLEGGHPRGGALLTTGRISSDMVVKAVVSECPVVASITGVTHLAAEIAGKLGVTLVSYVRGDRMEVSTHPERIVEVKKTILS